MFTGRQKRLCSRRQCFIDIMLIIITIIINVGALSTYKLENLEDVGVGVTIILIWMLQKYVV